MILPVREAQFRLPWYCLFGMIICNVCYIVYLKKFCQVDKHVIWVRNLISHIEIRKSIEGLDEEGATKNIWVKRQEKKKGVLTFNAYFIICVAYQYSKHRIKKGRVNKTRNILRKWNVKLFEGIKERVTLKELVAKGRIL